MISSTLLVAALVLAPMIGGGFGELSSSVLELLILAALVSYIISSRQSRNSWPRIPGIIPLGVFLLVVTISAFFTEAPYLSIKQLLFLCACVGGYAVSCAVCRDSKVAAAAVWGVAMSALVICLLGVRHYVVSTGGGLEFWNALLSKGDHMRLFGPFVNPGFFAGYLVLSIPVTMGVYLVTRRSVLALLAGVSLVLQVIALMLTGTKFGILAAVAALLLLFAMATLTKSLKHSKFRRVVFIALALIPLLYLFSGPVRSRIAAAESGGTQVHSTTFRVFTWKATRDMITHNLLTGVGPGAYEVAYPRYTIAGPTKYAHQSYLQLAAESGVIALAALLISLGVIAWRTLAGIIKRRSEAADAPRTRENRSASEGEITWKDLVPFSGWRMINCAIFAALTGSALRSLVDSDWYVAGIAFPFWILAGTLAAQPGVARGEVLLGRGVKSAIIALCGVLALLAASLGLADLLAPDEMQPNGANTQILQAYKRAKLVSPLNPRYRRELAKYLFAEGRTQEGLQEAGTAIRLSPTDGSNYFVRGVLYVQTGKIVQAQSDFQHALKQNPNSTNTLMQLASVYQMRGDQSGFESTLRRMLRIENSPYEQVKGAPELVDANFAHAHAYFGQKHLDQKRYKQAADEFSQATERLDRWKSSDIGRKIGHVTGTLNSQKERELLTLRRDCYLRLADAYAGLGDKTKAGSLRHKAEAMNVGL